GRGRDPGRGRRLDERRVDSHVADETEDPGGGVAGPGVPVRWAGGQRLLLPDAGGRAGKDTEAGRGGGRTAPTRPGPAGQVPPGASEEGRGREGRRTKEAGRRGPEHGAESVPGVPGFQGPRQGQGRRAAEGGSAGPVRRSLPSGVSDLQRDREGDDE